MKRREEEGEEEVPEDLLPSPDSLDSQILKNDHCMALILKCHAGQCKAIEESLRERFPNVFIGFVKHAGADEKLYIFSRRELERARERCDGAR